MRQLYFHEEQAKTYKDIVKTRRQMEQFGGYRVSGASDQIHTWLQLVCCALAHKNSVYVASEVQSEPEQCRYIETETERDWSYWGSSESKSDLEKQGGFIQL